MNKIWYLLSKIIFFFFSYKLEIVKPRKAKSLKKLPTTYKIGKYPWFTFILGCGLILVGFFGGVFFGLDPEPHTAYQLWEFLAFETVLILAFINQLLLKGEVVVTTHTIKFSYRYILGRVDLEEEISNYSCIWIRKYKEPGGINGRRYHVIYLKHKWNRFRTINLSEGGEADERAKYYSDLFNLQPKKSFVTILQ